MLLCHAGLILHISKKSYLFLMLCSSFTIIIWGFLLLAFSDFYYFTCIFFSFYFIFPFILNNAFCTYRPPYIMSIWSEKTNTAQKAAY